MATTNHHELSPADAATLKAFIALARQVKFPGGAGTRDLTKNRTPSRPECYLAWSKRGGHAGSRTVGNVAAAAKAAGFEPFDRKRHDVPDGSRIGSTGTYVKVVDGKVFATLECRTSYGAVASENSYGLTLKGPTLGAKEGV